MHEELSIVESGVREVSLYAGGGMATVPSEIYCRTITILSDPTDMAQSYSSEVIFSNFQSRQSGFIHTTYCTTTP